MSDWIRTVREALASRPAALAGTATGDGLFAAVALVLRPAPADVELLLIRRAVFAGAPWSGHMALPGGKVSPEDTDELAAAVRETREEVGIDVLARGELLGRLDDVTRAGSEFTLRISPFVFAVPEGQAVVPNREVAESHWVPLALLSHPASAIEHLHPIPAAGQVRPYPAIGYRGRVIWGLTYRVLRGFLAILPVAPAPGPSGEPGAAPASKGSAQPIESDGAT